MSKPKVFLTRKWPRKAEEALGEIFDVTFNRNDTRLSKIEIAKAFAIHDAIAPTFGIIFGTRQPTATKHVAVATHNSPVLEFEATIEKVIVKITKYH